MFGLQQLNNRAHRRRLARARSAGENGNFFGERSLDGKLLFLGQRIRQLCAEPVPRFFPTHVMKVGQTRGLIIFQFQQTLCRIFFRDIKRHQIYCIILDINLFL